MIGAFALSAADGVDDFHPIAVVQIILGVLATGHHLFVNLHGQPLAGKLETIDEAVQGQSLFEAALLAIEDDIHEARLRGHRREINTVPKPSPAPLP